MGSWRLVCQLSVALVLAGGLVLSVAAEGARAHRVVAGRQNPRLARIVSPQDQGVVVGAPVRVVVRLASGVRLVRAWANAEDVTKRFKRHGDRYVALLRRRRHGLSVGTDLVQISSRRGRETDFDTSRFVLAREHGSLLSGPPARRLNRAGQVTIRYRLASFSGKVRVRVNGKQDSSVRWARGHHAITLDGDDGLHAGENRVMVDAFTSRGLYDVERRTVRVRRRLPMPAAGKDRFTKPGRRVRLDARRSRALRGGRLSYRWRIVRAPRGSHPRLLHAWSARPVLRQHKFGTYRLRLTVSEHPRWHGPGRGGVAAQTASASDAVSVLSQPAPPIGVAIDTLAQSSPGASTGAVRLTTPTWGGTDSTVTYKTPDPGDPLQVVVLNRQTLELESNQGFSGDNAGTWALLQYVNSLLPSPNPAPSPSVPPLVIITTPSLGAIAPVATGPGTQYALGNLNAAIKAIGGEPIPPSAASPGGSFSVIGVPGMADEDGNPVSSAPENVGLKLSGGSSSVTTPSGDLRGYLQLTPTYRTFTFVSPDYVPFKTNAPTDNGTCSSPCQATITVGSQTYTSQLITSAQGGAGFYVLVLDAGDLSKVDDGTFGQNADGMAAMHNLLVKYTPAMRSSTAPYLVFVQSIGPATAQSGQAGGYWDQVAKDTSVIGGNPFLLRDLTGSRADGFALAGIGRPQGVSGIVPTTQVASEGYLGPWEAPGNHVIHGTLQGTLTRDYHSRFYPGGAGPPGSCSTQCPAQAADISQVAYQPPSRWPYRQNVAHHPYGDVLTCIVQWLNTRLSPTTLSLPVQQNYVNPPPGTGSSDWTTWSQIVQNTTADDLNGLPDQTCHNQNATDIATVSAQLGHEFQSVRVVRALIADMKAPFTQSEPGTFLDVQQIANTIKTSFPTQTLQQKLNGPGVASGLGIAASVVGIAAAASSAFPAAAAVLGVLSGALWVASEVETSDTGAQELPALPKPDLNGPALDLETRLSDRYAALANSQGGFDHLGDILVSDWGKLHTAATNGAAWDVGPESAATVNTLETSATRQGWETLFPQAYTEYNLSDLDNYQICSVSTLGFFEPQEKCLPASHYGTVGDPSDYACLPMGDWPGGNFARYGSHWWNKDHTPVTYNPFGTGVAASDQFQAPGSEGPQNIVFALPPTPVLYWWSKNEYNTLSQTTPPQSLTDEMFINPGDVPGNIGLNPLQFAIEGYGLSDAPNGAWGGGTANTITHSTAAYNEYNGAAWDPDTHVDYDYGTPCLVNGAWVDVWGNWHYNGS